MLYFLATDLQDLAHLGFLVYPEDPEFLVYLAHLVDQLVLDWYCLP